MGGGGGGGGAWGGITTNHDFEAVVYMRHVAVYSNLRHGKSSITVSKALPALSKKHHLKQQACHPARYM